MSLTSQQLSVLRHYLFHATRSRTPFLALDEAQQRVFQTLLQHPALDVEFPRTELSEGLLLANLATLQDKHPNYNSYNGYPIYYLDREFNCRDCGVEQVWTAEQQKWWYEEAGGSLHAVAVSCRACRQKQGGEPHEKS